MGSLERRKHNTNCDYSENDTSAKEPPFGLFGRCEKAVRIFQEVAERWTTLPADNDKSYRW